MVFDQRNVTLAITQAVIEAVKGMVQAMAVAACKGRL